MAATNWARINPGGFKASFEQKPIPVPTQERVDVAEYVPSKQSVAPSVSMPMIYQGLETLIKEACGGTPTSVQIGSTGVYTHTFVLGQTVPAPGLSLHWEPDGTAMSTAYRYDSAKINKLSFNQEIEKPLNLDLEFLGRLEATASTDTPSYPTQRNVGWHQKTTLTANGTAVKAQLASWELDNALAEDIYLLGSQVREDITRKDQRSVTGKLKVLVDSATVYNLFRNQTEVALVTEWTGDIAAGSTAFKMRITIPRLVFEGTPPQVDSHGPVWVELPWKAFYNGSADIIKIELDNLLTTIP